EHLTHIANHARLQAHALVLEPELLARSAPDHGRLALCQQLLEHRLVERPRPVRVGVGERGPLRGIGKAQVLELALAARQTPADLPEAVGAAELAEEHGDELTPAREPLGGVIGTMVFDRLLELKAGEELQQLREDARKSLHGRASLGDCVLAGINLTQVCTGRALLISYRRTPPESSVPRKTVLDKSDMHYITSKGRTIRSILVVARQAPLSWPELIGDARPRLNKK